MQALPVAPTFPLFHSVPHFSVPGYWYLVPTGRLGLPHHFKRGGPVLLSVRSCTLHTPSVVHTSAQECVAEPPVCAFHFYRGLWFMCSVFWGSASMLRVGPCTVQAPGWRMPVGREREPTEEERERECKHSPPDRCRNHTGDFQFASIGLSRR